MQLKFSERYNKDESDLSRSVKAFYTKAFFMKGGFIRFESANEAIKAQLGPTTL